MLPCTSLTLLLLAVLAVLLQPLPGQAANPKISHPHNGVLEKYELKIPKISLDSDALSKLEKGQPVKKQIQAAGKSGGRGIVIQDVHAPPAMVIDRILDFGNYNNMVPNVAQCSNYAVRKLRNGDLELKTRYVLSILGFKLEYYVRHIYRPSIHTLVWTLDYDRASDFDDTAGYWSVVPLKNEGRKEEGEWSRVFYSIDLRIPAWIPQFVVNILNTQALTSATAWVKTQSEKKFQASLSRKAGAPAPAAAPAVFVMMGIADGSSAKRVEEKKKRRFGGGDLWEGFIDEFSDIIDTEKYAEKVKAKEQKRKEKEGKKQKRKEKEGKKGKKGKEGEKEEMPGPGHDDARNVLVFLWVSILTYGLIQLWSKEVKNNTKQQQQLQQQQKQQQSSRVATA